MPFHYTRSNKIPPQGIRFFKQFKFGNLADLELIETRQNRDEQISSPGFLGSYVPEGLIPTVDAALSDLIVILWNQSNSIG